MDSIMKIGVIGCGKIASAYGDFLQRHQGLAKLDFCADVDIERARAFAESYGVEGGSVEELLGRDDIGVVLNLTPPEMHVEVALQSLQHGKHAYSEKPLGVDLQEAIELRDQARETGLLVGVAPDTFFGSGQQKVRQMIDSGVIGEPLSATAFMGSQGVDRWHPNPFFYYTRGGGPMLDMGPYYLTALINLLGPIESVFAMGKRAWKERKIYSEPHAGTMMPVEVDTHLSALLKLECGVHVNMITSFDMAGHHLPKLEIHGTKGSISVPDPNGFSDSVEVVKWGEREWKEVSVTEFNNRENSRGIGLIDLVDAFHRGRPPRAGIDMGFHVLEVMDAVLRGGQELITTIDSTCEQPAPLASGLDEGRVS